MRARVQIRAGRKSVLTEWVAGKNLETITTKMIAQAASEGDALALDMLQHTAEYLGIAIANLVNILNPQMVVLGGPVSRWGGLLIEATRQEVKKRALVVPFRCAQIMRSQAEEIAVPLGAAVLVIRLAGKLLATP